MTLRSRLTVLGLAITAPALLFVVPPVVAQSAAASKAAAHVHPVPSATAVPKRGAFVLDGRVDDDAWQQATPVTDLKQFDPDHAEPSSERIDVRFMYDDAALYVGARLYDRQGDSGIVSSVVRRDAFFNSDFFEVVIDGFHDHLGMAFFQVNPTGSRTDMQGNANSCCDDGWDPVWVAKTHIDSEGWSVEMRIPFSQLRFSRDSVQTWGLQIRRFLKRRNETAQWAMWTRNEQGGPARFGHLEGLRIAATPKNLEILPYAAMQAARVGGDPADPFRSGTQGQIRVGADVKYLLTPNLTIDATINPDFGQVEADPAVVNLTAFENFFSERRPFFISGSGVFTYGGINCRFCSNASSMQGFYSRRVGRAPTGADLALAQGPFADVPQSSPILGAAKLTGRTSSGYTVGLLNAVTGKAFADVQRVDGSRASQLVEPLSNFLVGRLKKDYRAGDLVVGVI
ncbi:MAG: carbohydrate binding family 9 domain-containing protein, partial [Gemmatimonadaceae bacterium]|nr:carbohydrate binding family 9 domain-containing protein [Gemmatimonadaceae bacterium]